MTRSELVTVMTTQYVLKSGWEVLSTPLTYKLVNFLKRAEHEDYYDRDTNFTPFSLRVSDGRAGAA
jgi:queuosine precursor transporter